MTPEFLSIKNCLEEYYHQPDIPLQPPLDAKDVPLSAEQLEKYLMTLDMGLAWLLVPGAQEFGEVGGPPSSKKLRLE